MMNDMMHDTFVIGTARKAQIAGWNLAGKTGTTEDYKDAWFVGFSGLSRGGVWLGNDDGTLTKRVVGRQPADGGLAQFHESRPEGSEAGASARAATISSSRARSRWRKQRSQSRLGESAWIRPQPRPRRAEKNFFEKLFGL